ncbi:MAG: hypothetical protein JW712_13200 [Dehalococcoidales bacterium]|nr:hypothetical protein [Dehalococcoidales bacterium]
MEEKSKEQLFQEREKRVSEAVQLKVPDRVPIEMSFGYFPAKYAGITCKAAYYDFDTWLDATRKTILDFEPDALCHVQGISPGHAMEYLEPRSMRWPGYGVPDEFSHQAIEGEWMKADEYDAFFNDRADYLLRTYLPRVSGAMEPLKDLPKLSELGYGFYGAMALAQALAKPEIAEAIAKLQKAGEELAEYYPKMMKFEKEIQELGFPLTGMGPGGAPFDVISDNIRGMAGAMLDMFRQPEKLMKAHDEILEKTLERIAALPQCEDNTRVFMALHRGSDGFMSLKQFEKFYWPGLKAVILAIVDKGFVPGIFFEGNWTQRLEYLAELPPGKVLGHFDTTDIFKAKEVLKDNMCIRGNVPATLLRAGTSDSVKEFCKKLIDIVGKDGGLIVCPSVVPDEGTAENIHAMIDFTKEYGVYN